MIVADTDNAVTNAIARAEYGHNDDDDTFFDSLNNTTGSTMDKFNRYNTAIGTLLSHQCKDNCVTKYDCETKFNCDSKFNCDAIVNINDKSICESDRVLNECKCNCSKDVDNVSTCRAKCLDRCRTNCIFKTPYSGFMLKISHPDTLVSGGSEGHFVVIILLLILVLLVHYSRATLLIAVVIVIFVYYDLININTR